jgi:hypothetical protein
MFKIHYKILLENVYVFHSYKNMIIFLTKKKILIFLKHKYVKVGDIIFYKFMTTIIIFNIRNFCWSFLYRQIII